MSGAFKQCVGAKNVGLDKCRWPKNRAVHMTLSRQMYNGVGAVLLKDAINSLSITYIPVLKPVSRALAELGKVIQISGIGELIENNHLIGRGVNDMPHQRRTDKPGTARYQ